MAKIDSDEQKWIEQNQKNHDSDMDSRAYPNPFTTEQYEAIREQRKVADDARD